MNTTTAQAACGKISRRASKTGKADKIGNYTGRKQSCHKWDQIIKLCSAGIISYELLCLFYQHLGHCLPFGYILYLQVPGEPDTVP